MHEGALDLSNPTTLKDLREILKKDFRSEVTSILEDLRNAQKAEYLSKKQISDIFGVTLSTTNMWIRKGVLKSYGFPNTRRVFFKRAEVEETLIQINE